MNYKPSKIKYVTHNGADSELDKMLNLNSDTAFSVQKRAGGSYLAVNLELVPELWFAQH